MKNSCSFLQPSVLTLTCCLLLFSNCGHTVMPRQVPFLKGYDTISLQGADLIIVNAEKDASASAIPDDTGTPSALRASRQVWTKALVESLSAELARRGAQLESKASLKLSISIPEIIVAHEKDRYRFTLIALAASSTGWEKRYSGTAESEAGNFETVPALSDRLASQVLSEVVKEMMGDAEFLMQVRTR